MKIAFMIRNLNEKGGINVYTINLIENILQLDQESEFLFIYSDEAFLGRFSKYMNVKEVVVWSPAKILWDQIMIPWILRKEKVDLVFNPKLSIPLFTRSKKVLMIHGAEQFAVRQAFKWYDRIYVHIAMPLYARFANKVLTTTQIGIDDLSRHLRIKKEKFVFVHEGVNERFKVLDDDLIEQVRMKYNLPKRFIFFVGGLNPLKNFGRVAQAVEKVIEQLDYKLVVVGFKRFKFQEDMKMAEGLIAKDKIIFSGFVPDEDLPAFYNLADLFVFPSLYEGFGLPALEAMACGCPVLSSTAGCNREVTGDAALLADPYDVGNIAEKMITLLMDQNLKDSLVKKGFHRVREFSWKKCAQETLEIFKIVD